VVYPESSELTTIKAAELLGVSRPFLIGVLESGAIPQAVTKPANRGRDGAERLTPCYSGTKPPDSAEEEVAGVEGFFGPRTGLTPSGPPAAR
jgi:hypothetical protein